MRLGSIVGYCARHVSGRSVVQIHPGALTSTSCRMVYNEFKIINRKIILFPIALFTPFVIVYKES